MAGPEIDVRRTVLLSLIESSWLKTRRRDWVSGSARTRFGYAMKLTRVMKSVLDALHALNFCEVSNDQVVPNDDFARKLATCVFELFALIGCLRFDQRRFANMLLAMLDTKEGKR